MGGRVGTYTADTPPSRFWFARNLQGDIVAIYDDNGVKQVSYVYDAFGNYTQTTHVGGTKAVNNRLLYRGYYYDSSFYLYRTATRWYDPLTGRFISPDVYVSTGQGLIGNNMYAYCNNNPVMLTDSSGCAPEWMGNLLKGIGVLAGTALFVAAIVASAGAVGALAGVGAAAFGLSTTAVSTVTTIITVSTYIVAGGVGLFGASDAVEAFSGGVNPIRDYVMDGNQTAYDITKGAFDALGTVAVVAGMVGPKVLQKIAQHGTPKVSKGKTLGHAIDFYDKQGNWNLRIDATTHGNPNSAPWHHNPHYHVVNRDGKGYPVYYFWEVLKIWF